MRLPRLDVTLVLGRLVCRVRGSHVLPPNWSPSTPWERPRCWTCGTRIERPIFRSGGPVRGGAILYHDPTEALLTRDEVRALGHPSTPENQS